MIKVSNLNKYYHKGKENEIHVINETNLILPNSGFVVFLGASGSGKTTLINVIAGLDKAKGEITYDDVTFKNYKMGKVDKYRRENIGYVFQNYNLLNNSTVYENLRLTLELMGITNKEEVDERIDYVLDILGMKKYKNKLASNLSGGQMQRVSIARALVKDSKIIIADEPTGNLDSENTIEVMNILKRISLDRLVIMVTHDKKNAKFYADRIVEIKDGKVENDFENKGDDSLDNYDKSKIYLKDLKNEVLQVGNIKINLYLEENSELKDLDLTLVQKDGIVYLKNDEISYLDKDSKVKLIDDNYKAIKKDDIMSFEYNPKPFTETKKKFSLRPFLHSLHSAYVSHRNSSKKMKGLHACFIIIGVVMAFCVLALSVGTYVKGNQVEYSNSGIVLKRVDSKTFDDTMTKAIEEGLIVDSVNASVLTYKSYAAGDVHLTKSCYMLNKQFINSNVLEGVSEVNDDEVVITSRIADEIIKTMSNIEIIDYKSLIGKYVYQTSSSDELKIVGIVSSDSTSFYTNRYSYYDALHEYDSYSLDKGNVSADLTTNYSYTLAGGRNIEADDECLVEISSYINNYIGKDKLFFNDKELKIVGIYEVDDIKRNISKPTILVNDVEIAKESLEDIDSFGSMLLVDNVEILSGSKPTGFKQILVSEHYAEGLNTDLDNYIKKNNFEIVGTFKSNYSDMAYSIACSKEAVIYRYAGSDVEGETILTTDDNKVIEMFKESGSTYQTSYTYEHNLRVKQKREMFGSTITISMVFLVIIVIYTFFMMRSKMIHRIYEIGVLREIGASRMRIYRVFFAELLVLVTMTTMVGYLGSLVLCYFADKKIGGLLGLFRYSPLYAILGFFILYGVSIIAGMLPILTLQRKTPAEIVAKYDL